MKLLAWDTSAKEGAIVTLEWDEKSKAGWPAVRLVGEWSLNVALTHSDRLLWGIHQVLEASQWKLEEVDLFGVGVGPGSFTGLRVGITTARTLASTLNKPLIGVSSLVALARPAASWLAQLKERVVVVAATDACKGELFGLWGAARSILDCVAKSQSDAPGFWKRGVEEEVLEPSELMRALKKKCAEGDSRARWLAVGEGTERYLDEWRALPANRRFQAPGVFPHFIQGRYLGQLVWEGYQAGLARDALALHPRYLRVSDAELKLKAGLLKPQGLRGHS